MKASTTSHDSNWVFNQVNWFIIPVSMVRVMTPQQYQWNNSLVPKVRVMTPQQAQKCLLGSKVIYSIQGSVGEQIPVPLIPYMKTFVIQLHDFLHGRCPFIGISRVIYTWFANSCDQRLYRVIEKGHSFEFILVLESLWFHFWVNLVWFGSEVGHIQSKSKLFGFGVSSDWLWSWIHFGFGLALRFGLTIPILCPFSNKRLNSQFQYMVQWDQPSGSENLLTEIQ